MSFFKRLRERRLFQIVAFYAIAGWGVLQVADQLVDRFPKYVPGVVYEVLFIWFLTGLPAALLIGWHHGEKGRQRAPLTEVILLILLAGVGLGFSGMSVNRKLLEVKQKRLQENPLELRGLAVRYFDDRSSDNRYEYIADALTEGLIDELSEVDGLQVVSRNATAPYRDLSIASDSVASALRVASVIEGDVEVVGDKLRVHIRIIDGASGAPVRRATVAAPIADLESMRTGLVRETAELLRKHIGDEITVRERAAATDNADALTLVFRAEKVRKDGEARIADGDMNAGLAMFVSADNMLAQAEAADRKWVDPIVQRAAIAYRRAYLAKSQPEQALTFIKATMDHANRALDVDRSNARALELRGTATYYQFLLRIADTPEQLAGMRDAARRDLLAAIRIKPELATAHATLSHLYFGENITQSVIEARDAYRYDAYLESADLVLWRLFTGLLDLQDFTEAKKFCDEGHRRFDQDFRFVSCQLRLMTVPAGKVNIADAWSTFDQLESVLPEPRRAFETVRGEITVAGAIAMAAKQEASLPDAARSVLIDSARAVLNRASIAITPELDPTGELLLTEAYIRILTGEKDRSVKLLTRYALEDPDAFDRSRGELPWWYRDLQDMPEARRLFGLN
jgi:TolB-like protein